MTVSPGKFFKGFALALPICLLGYLGLRFFGPFTDSADPEAPATLTAQAIDALEAVKRRQPRDRRPASYDSILTPLDKLLRQARDLAHGVSFNPEADFPALRALTVPVMDIATRADAQARTETGPLAKNFRFNEQKAEAAQYLAAAMWERIMAKRPPRPQNGAITERAPALPETEMNELRRVLDEGLKANPDNAELWYIRGVANRAEGNFATAAKDLARATTLAPGYAAAWNVLGLTRIALKEFDAAEEALERAKALALEEAKQVNAPLGAEYAAIIYNLGTFHEGLAVFYNRENRIAPSVETRRLAARHSAEARKYLEEFLRLEPADSADAQDARTRLRAL